MTPRSAAALAFLCLTTFVPRAEATVARAAAFDEKVDKAAAIVLGKCTQTRAQWDPSRRWIVTYSTFQVEETLKGTHVPELTVVTPGGSVDGIHQDSIGIPSFREGEENVVFVKESRLGPTVLYFDQGAYEVVRDARGERIIAPVATDAVHVDTQRGVAVAPEGAKSLREFRESVRQSARRGHHNRMQMLERQRRREEASFDAVVERYGVLIAIALAGAAIATWQLIRRH